MSGMADWQAKISIDIEDLKKRVKVAEGELDKITKEDRKIKLDLDTKTLESAIQKLDKMLDSLGKGTGDFKQLESLSKELSSIATEIQSLSKAFGKVDDSGAKTLLSSIQNIDRSLFELSQNILNVNKNMSNMGGNTNDAVRQVENIGNAAADAVKQIDEFADAQSKLGNKTNISSGLKDAFQGSDEIASSSEKASNAIKEENNILDQNTQKAKENADAKQKVADANKDISNTDLSKYSKKLDSYSTKLSSYQATAKRFEDGGWTSDTYKNNIGELNTHIREYKALLDSIQKDPSLVTDENISQLNRYESQIKETINAISNMSASQKGYTQLSGQKALDKINKLLKENSAMSREAKNQIKAWYNEIASGNPSASLDVILGKVQKIVNEEAEAGRAGKSMWAAIKEKAWYGVAGAVGTYFGVNDIFRYVGQGVQTVRELNTAMVEVRKVSDETESSYQNFQKTMAATAKEIASTNKELINSSADFLRLGYSIDQASDLAKNATLFVNVGDGVDISEATEDMITAMKAFDIQAEDSIKIVDDYNQIGNKFALSATDIGESMKRSASALETGNNSFEESIALITAMNEIVQNSENTGNTLKVFSLRLRGAKAELEDMGEDTDGLCESSSKLREQLQALTGVDIMLDDNTFKSTTQIVKELGAVWDKLSDSSQAATLELIAGKTRANNVAALLKNYQQIDKVLESLGDAEGSALRENSAIVDSIDGRIKILSASMENFWQTLIDDSVIKKGVSALTSLVEGGTKLVDTFGLLPPILTAVGAALSFKNVGGSKMYDLICFE